MKTQELDSYSVFVQVRHQKSIEVEVVAHANEATVLLGRDVLNHLRIVLDGPNKILEIG